LLSAILHRLSIWWLCILAVTFCGAVLRYSGYNFSLPYVDHPDEPAYVLAARMTIDFGSPKPLGMQGYPPGIIAVNYFFLRWLGDDTIPPTSILWLTRLVSITFSLGVIVLVARMLRNLGSPFAGLLFALVMVFNPVLTEYSRYATADNFVTFFSIASLFLTLEGIRTNSAVTIRNGLFCLIIAIVFKYQAVFLLPLILFLQFTQWFSPRCNNHEVIRVFRHSLGYLFVFFFWLIFLFPALEVGQSPAFTAAESRRAIPTPEVIYANLVMVMNQISPITGFWLVGFTGLLLLFLPKIRRNVSLFGLGTLACACGSWLIGVSFYGVLGSQEFRQFITSGTILTALAAMGFALWATALSQVANSFRQPLTTTDLNRVTQSVITVSLIALLIPQAQQALHNAHQHTLPDRRNNLAYYMDATLPSGSYISNVDNHKTFNRDWGGYRGETRFPLFRMVSSITEQPISYWRNHDVEYAIVPWNDYQQLTTQDDMQTELSQTVVLKQYPSSPEYRDGGMLVLRLTPIQTRFNSTLQLGTLTYLGYDLSNPVVQAGDSITFRMYWRADHVPNCDAAVFNHLVDSDGDLIVQVDGTPVSIKRPTTTWDDPTEILVSQFFTLQVPASAPPAQYALHSGFYCRDTGERFLAENNEDFVRLFNLTITSEPAII
jgi:hypothetical protein